MNNRTTTADTVLTPVPYLAHTHTHTHTQASVVCPPDWYMYEEMSFMDRSNKKRAVAPPLQPTPSTGGASSIHLAQRSSSTYTPPTEIKREVGTFPYSPSPSSATYYRGINDLQSSSTAAAFARHDIYPSTLIGRNGSGDNGANNKSGGGGEEDSRSTRYDAEDGFPCSPELFVVLRASCCLGVDVT